jgi:hypothetical protein
MNERDKEIVMEFYGSAGTEQELKLAALIRADEREACAKVADYFKKQTFMEWPDQIAEAIRARGTK